MPSSAFPQLSLPSPLTPLFLLSLLPRPQRFPRFIGWSIPIGVFFLGDAPNAFFYLSGSSNPLVFKALNKGSPILQPTCGTKGVRDPSVISETEQKMERKWHIISTDLDIGKTTWDASQRKGKPEYPLPGNPQI
jgi:hypothetical protein